MTKFKGKVIPKAGTELLVQTYTPKHMVETYQFNTEWHRIVVVKAWISTFNPDTVCMLGIVKGSKRKIYYVDKWTRIPKYAKHLKHLSKLAKTMGERYEKLAQRTAMRALAENS